MAIVFAGSRFKLMQPPTRCLLWSSPIDTYSWNSSSVKTQTHADIPIKHGIFSGFWLIMSFFSPKTYVLIIVFVQHQMIIMKVILCFISEFLCCSMFFHQTNINKSTIAGYGSVHSTRVVPQRLPASATASKVDRQPCSLVQGGTNVKMAIEFATVNLSIFDRKGIFNVHIESSSFIIFCHMYP